MGRDLFVCEKLIAQYALALARKRAAWPNGRNWITKFQRRLGEGDKVATAAAIEQVQTASRASTIAAAVFLAFIGLSLVWVSGFANAAELHNGAHDSRHSLVFPCH
ncbi:MAG: hypothetical protein GKS02_06815 [Alphaproteobacteria bacterium]|nr:hypothetical protein [Alphaproteobacteria bacterium]